MKLIKWIFIFVSDASYWNKTPERRWDMLLTISMLCSLSRVYFFHKMKQLKRISSKRSTLVYRKLCFLIIFMFFNCYENIWKRDDNFFSDKGLRKSKRDRGTSTYILSTRKQNLLSLITTGFFTTIWSKWFIIAVIRRYLGSELHWIASKHIARLSYGVVN